jgi:hypothetical protein
LHTTIILIAPHTFKSDYDLQLVLIDHASPLNAQNSGYIGTVLIVSY